MLEILALFFLTKRIGEIVEEKGRKTIGYKLLTVALWIGGEVISPSWVQSLSRWRGCLTSSFICSPWAALRSARGSPSRSPRCCLPWRSNRRPRRPPSASVVRGKSLDGLLFRLRKLGVVDRDVGFHVGNADHQGIARKRRARYDRHFDTRIDVVFFDIGL